MPAFIETLLNPFINLLSLVGVPVQKTEYNPFMDGNTMNDQEINADVREVKESELETPGKVVEIVDPIAKSHPHSDAIMEKFDCDPETPILMINKDKLDFITRTVNRKIDFSWDLYPKVSEIKFKNKFGIDTSLQQLLNEVSQAKATNTPHRFRPKPFIIQGGPSDDINEPTTVSEPIEHETSSVNASTRNPCNDEHFKTKPNFPVYSPNCTALNCNQN